MSIDWDSYHYRDLARPKHAASSIEQILTHAETRPGNNTETVFIGAYLILAANGTTWIRQLASADLRLSTDTAERVSQDFTTEVTDLCLARDAKLPVHFRGVEKTRFGAYVIDSYRVLRPERAPG